MRNKLSGILSIVILVLISYKGFALQIIRDDETELFMHSLANNLLKSAGQPQNSLNIYLAINKEFNAFVFPGRNLVMNTGTIINSSYLMVAGIMAHEIGHIAAGHLQLQALANQNYQLQRIAGLITGGILLASGIPEGATAAISASEHAALMQRLKHSRRDEAMADNLAIRFLAQTSINPNGMREAMQYLTRYQRLQSSATNSYLYTHPLSTERLSNISLALQKYDTDSSSYNNSSEREFASIKAKLSAYLLGNTELMHAELDRDFGFTEANDYWRAILLYRRHQHKKAEEVASRISDEHPNNPYIYELRAQIAAGCKDLNASINFYEKALALLPKAISMKIDAARVAIMQNNPSGFQKAITWLEQVMAVERDNLMAIRQLITAYGKLGKMGEAYYWQAEEQIIISKPIEARNFIEKAEPLLAGNSIYLAKLNDLKKLTLN